MNKQRFAWAKIPSHYFDPTKIGAVVVGSVADNNDGTFSVNAIDNTGIYVFINNVPAADVHFIDLEPTAPVLVSSEAEEPVVFEVLTEAGGLLFRGFAAAEQERKKHGRGEIRARLLQDQAL